jgi:hypothetical protein
MRTRLLLVTSLAGSLAPLYCAIAHGVTGGEEDAGNELFWIYGLLLVGIAGFVIYRKWWRGRVSPERRALRRRLSEFERALTLCRAQLQNAEDYPKECGLTEEQRLERLQSAASIQEKIDEIKMDLAAT